MQAVLAEQKTQLTQASLKAEYALSKQKMANEMNYGHYVENLKAEYLMQEQTMATEMDVHKQTMANEMSAAKAELAMAPSTAQTQRNVEETKARLAAELET